jgi:hypothetical protein
MIESTQCSVPVSVLTSAPYNLVLGDSIYAKVISFNFYGQGATSVAGNGATIVLVPSAPITLTNDGTLTSDLQVGFTWSNGPSTGGRSIIDYKVWYDQSLGEYIVLAEGVLTRSYLTEVSLIKGQTYNFKV